MAALLDGRPTAEPTRAPAVQQKSRLVEQLLASPVQYWPVPSTVHVGPKRPVSLALPTRQLSQASPSA